MINRKLKILIKFSRDKSSCYSEELRHYLSRPFERLLHVTVANFPYLPDQNSQVGYLIITWDDFAGYLSPLVEWKMSKGLHITLTTLSEISPTPTAQEIRAYIQEAYETWVIPPSYVLLVGDVDHIPSWKGDSSGYYTDLYYSTMDDDGDIFPDLWVGRLSVETSDQLSSIVEKIIDYEKADLNFGDAWMQRAYFITSDDLAYHQVAESTHVYCMEVAREQGMICDSLWGYYGTGTPIDTAFNDGRTIVVYSGHGSITGWGGPKFSISDVESLANFDRYPFVLSHACYTGVYTSTCFGEALIRGTGYGALAFLGASGPTYWEQDDSFQRFIFDALFSDSIYTLGEIIEYAKYRMLRIDDTLYAHYYEVYNLLGDPSLDIYTDSPHPIRVDHPDTIPSGLYILEVEVTDSSLPVYHALVSCTTDTIWTAYTDSLGIARLELVTSVEDTVWITVTGHNLKPYQAYILTTSEDVAESKGRFAEFLLLQNHPNPFRETTEIGYYVEKKDKLILEIYDSTGRIIRNQIQRVEPGYHIFRWNGRDNTGRRVSSGIYFYRLKRDGKYLTKKMALVR